MSCKSAIYTVNGSPSTLTLTTNTPGATLPLGTTNRRFGCNLQQSGNGILAEGQGYYDIEANVSLTPATAGTYTVGILADGVLIPSAFQTITAVAGATIAFNVPGVERLRCCDDTTTFTVALTTTATLPVTVALNNVAVKVEKL